MNISAKSDYAVRAMLTLAAGGSARPIKGETLATSQDIPVKFLENILVDLRRAGLVASQRGADGGYRLNRPAEEISLADVIRAVDGPLANIRGVRPEEAEYHGPAESLQRVWIAMRAALRSVLEEVSLADVAGGTLPAPVGKLTADPDAWAPH
ncbi:MAG TPA: Rrf2 family transcriptional regulator [Acidimicrobiales bacterium]